MSKLRYLKSPLKLIRALGKRGWFNWIPDRQYLKLVYWGETGKRLNIENPVTYNEKLQWLKLNDRNPDYCKYVDKYEVRSYIKEAIGEEYLIPILGLYNKVEEIDWASLPQRFVLKCTHGSGSNIICYDKSSLDREKAIQNLNQWMGKSWFWFGREWPYKNIKPRIICEQFISEGNKAPEDYKVMCFNGIPKLIQVHFNRFSGVHEVDNYDINWEKTGISQSCSGLPNSQTVIPKPYLFEQMIGLSQILAKNKYHVRIDWYIVEDKLYFGEITFYDASGFAAYDNEEDDYLLGSWIDIK